MDIRKILEEKKREIEGRLAKNGTSPSSSLPRGHVHSPSSSSSSSLQLQANGAVVDISGEMEEAIHRLAREVVREAGGQSSSSVVHAVEEPHGNSPSSGHLYEFLSHPTSPEYQRYQDRLHELRQIELLAKEGQRKRPLTEVDGLDDGSGGGSGQWSSTASLPPQPKKKSSRWGPEALEAGPSVSSPPPPPLLNEEQASALELMHLRQQLAARDKALTAKAGLAELQFGLPSSEHRMRALEMEKTKEKASLLTKAAAGKHHMSHFLPKEELAKFLKPPSSSGTAAPVAQYEENKLTDNNVGYQMLKKFGWSEGKGLGSAGTGISAPINSVTPIERAGLGTKKPDQPTEEDDQFSLYRKRMMTAYKYRPNPLNNPRRPYY